VVLEDEAFQVVNSATKNLDQTNARSYSVKPSQISLWRAEIKSLMITGGGVLGIVFAQSLEQTNP
jgi:pyruvate/2-oxoglutarate dehydrogenase complex dihydrolipoamide dehydrogenase (E3) component